VIAGRSEAHDDAIGLLALSALAAEPGGDEQVTAAEDHGT
jgi:hypothetical protein